MWNNLELFFAAHTLDLALLIPFRLLLFYFLARRPRGGRLMWCGNVCNCQTVDNHIYLRFLSEHTFSSGVFNEGLAQTANQRQGVSWGKEENHLITLDISYTPGFFFLSLFRPAHDSLTNSITNSDVLASGSSIKLRFSTVFSSLANSVQCSLLPKEKSLYDGPVKGEDMRMICKQDGSSPITFGKPELERDRQPNK